MISRLSHLQQLNGNNLQKNKPQMRFIFFRQIMGLEFLVLESISIPKVLGPF